MSVKVFISATSKDLGSARRIARDALLKLNIHPIEQTDFAPDYRTVEEMLRERIDSCEAVIHIVGRRYGAEPNPADLPTGKPRRSYTQMEYDTARKLGKKLYVFVCTEDFPYDDAHLPPEDESLRTLQESYRNKVLADEQLYTLIADAQILGNRVRELQVELNQMKASASRSARRLPALLTALLMTLGVISYAVFKIIPEMTEQTHSATMQNQEILRQLNDRALGQSYNEALILVAKKNDMSVDEVSSAIEAWTLATIANPKASKEDRNLAFSHLLDWETGGKEFYNKCCSRPNYTPYAYSGGVIIGFGYDLGHSSQKQIEEDWGNVLEPDELHTALSVRGLTGEAAQSAAERIRTEIKVTWDEALKVFATVTYPKWEQKTREVFPNFDELPRTSQAALVSLVINMGPRLKGPRREEMRAIADLMKRREFSEIPDQIRAMQKYYEQIPGLVQRRLQEAEQFEQGLTDINP
jgi:GH24 family phage-related lysozyme (muramidase)